MSQEQSSPQSVDAAQAAANNAQTALVSGKTGPTKPAGANAANTMIANVGDLQAKEPVLYKKIVQGLAQNICDELKKHADRMKELYRDNAKA